MVTFAQPEAFQVNAIAGGPQGEIVLAGLFAGTIDFGGGTRTASQATSFWASFDAKGSYLADRTYEPVRWSQVLVDAAGNLVAAGTLIDTDLSGQPLAAGRADFVAGLDAAGDVRWSKVVPSSGGDPPVSSIGQGGGIGVDRCGNVLVAGWSHPEQPVPDVQGSGQFVTKYDPSGAALWSKSGLDSGIHGDQTAVLAVDDRDAVYLGGGPDATLVKLDAEGHLLWSKPIDLRTDWIGVDAAGEVALDTTYDEAFDLGAVHLPDPGQNMVAVLRFDALGSAVSATTFPPPGQGFLAFSLDASGVLLAAGSAPATVTVSEIDPQGKPLWSWSPPSGGMQSAFAAAFDQRGYPLVAGLLPAQGLFLAFDGAGP
jgi:hypothetical protein